MAFTTEELGRRLVQARKTVGLTPVQVGEYLKVPREWVSSIEQGRRSVTIPILQSLADLYGMDIERFFDDGASADAEFDAIVLTGFCAADIHAEDLDTIRWLQRLARNLHNLNRLLTPPND